MNENNLTDEKLSETCQQKCICSSCGGALKYLPRTQYLKCESCGSQFTIEPTNSKIEEQDYAEYIANNIGTQDIQTIHIVECANCGARISFDNNIVSDKCPFCNSILVVSNTTDESQIRPSAMIPFNINAQQAVNAVNDWLRHAQNVPNDFSKQISNIETLKGLYIPYWTFNASTHTSYQGERGDNYVEVEKYYENVGSEKVERTRNISKTRWTNVSGEVSKDFQDMLISASKSLLDINASIFDSLNTKALVPYNEQFLYGFRAETYQIQLDEACDAAQKRISSAIHSQICRQIGGDNQQVNSKKVEYNSLTFKHILLPLYATAYKYKDKVYQVVVNGVTGEVRGEHPRGKSINFAYIVIIIMMIIYYLMKHFGNN